MPWANVNFTFRFVSAEALVSLNFERFKPTLPNPHTGLQRLSACLWVIFSKLQAAVFTDAAFLDLAAALLVPPPFSNYSKC